MSSVILCTCYDAKFQCLVSSLSPTCKKRTAQNYYVTAGVLFAAVDYSDFCC